MDLRFKEAMLPEIDITNRTPFLGEIPINKDNGTVRFEFTIPKYSADFVAYFPSDNQLKVELFFSKLKQAML